MEKARRLAHEAKEAAKFRGHDMATFRWSRRGDGRLVGISSCRKCKMDMDVLPNPLPNEVEIGGEAVALNCQPKED